MPVSGACEHLAQTNLVTGPQIEAAKKSQIEKKYFLDALIQSGAISTRDLWFCSKLSDILN